MDIERLIKEAHENAVEKGFYERNANTGELLALIVGELCGETLEAHRCGRFAKLDRYDRPGVIKDEYFNWDIKGTFEDEIADVFIRLFDFCGYKGIIPSLPYPHKLEFSDNMGENLGAIARVVLAGTNGVTYRDWSGYIFQSLFAFCEKYGVDIEKHIEAKMAFNRTRPVRHGKEY